MAPLFRALGRRYNIDFFMEGLVEGFSTGHPDKPEFVFELDELTQSSLTSSQYKSPNSVARPAFAYRNLWKVPTWCRSIRFEARKFHTLPHLSVSSAIIFTKSADGASPRVRYFTTTT
jgi:hypothetical protein